MTLTVDECIKLKLVHEVHTSERRSFRACRRRWDWHFRHAYYPLVTAKPLEFGVAYHNAMEMLYDPDSWKWTTEAKLKRALTAFDQTCEKQLAKALEVQDRITLDTEIQEDYNERVELGRGMIRYYATEVSPKLDIGWKPVRVEIAFMVPVPHPDTGKTITCYCDNCYAKWLKSDYAKAELAACADYNHDHDEIENRQGHFHGLPVVYAGRIDMLAKDDNGALWIFDWKTAASIPDNHEFLFLDDQISSYVWALVVGLGLKVRGFVYHEQRKGFPGAPKENKHRRLGRLFSVAANQDTDYDTYLSTVKEHDTEAYDEGLYDEFLHFLREEGITYYHREKVYKSFEELQEVGYNIGLEVLDMIDPQLRIYPSAGRFGCSFCAFQQPCREKNSKGDYQYALDTMYEQKEHYYVRTEASTESKGGE